MGMVVVDDLVFIKEVGLHGMNKDVFKKMYVLEANELIGVHPMFSHNCN